MYIYVYKRIYTYIHYLWFSNKIHISLKKGTSDIIQAFLAFMSLMGNRGLCNINAVYRGHSEFSEELQYLPGSF